MGAHCVVDPAIDGVDTLFLLSDEASYITWVALPVDGGCVAK